MAGKRLSATKAHWPDLISLVMDYSYARLSRYDYGVFRIIGSGLGNLLFPWARFTCATKKYNLSPIAPTWLQIRIGPILRGEEDKKFYFDLFGIPEEQIRGVQKIYLLRKLPHLSEREYVNGAKHDDSDRIVIFEGLGGFFSEMLKEHSLVKEELLRMTLDKHKKGLRYDFGGSMSIHVRLGDFSVPKDKSILEQGEWCYRIPISWYVRMISQIRHNVDKEMPVYVFSDGADEELSQLLSMPLVRRISFGSTVADLLALSRANVLIASASTFSMWASYLGRMPTIFYKGQSRGLYYDNPTSEIECGEDDPLPDSFLERISGRETTPDGKLA